MARKRTSQRHARDGERTQPARPSTVVPREPLAFFSSRITPALLFLAAVAVFLPAVHGQFLWDDERCIQNNLLLRHGWGLWKIWQPGAIAAEDHYWPLTYTLLWAQWQAWADRTTGYHVVNLLLHGAIVVQLWRLMRRIGLKGAWLGAALFAVHPVHTEAIAWVIGLKDLLTAFLYLLAIELYLNHEDRGGWKWLALSGVALAAAMLCKSTPVTLPVALAILVWYRRGHFAQRDVIGLAVIAAIAFTMCVLDFALGKKFVGASVAIPPLTDRLVQAGRAFWFYAEKLVWPSGLSPIYPQWQLAANRTLDWLPLLATMAVTILLWIARRRIGCGPLACWLFYGVTLAPVLGIVYFNFLAISPAADRYQYLASIAPLAGCGTLLASFIKRGGLARIAAYSAAAVVLIVCAVISLRQSALYRDQETLFTHALQVAPRSAEVHWSLGAEDMRKNRYRHAEPHFKEAFKLKPNLWGAVTPYGICLSFLNRDPEAVALYESAIARGCPDLTVRSNLAWILAVSPDPKARNSAKALELATQLVHDAGDNPDPYFLNSLAAAQAANNHITEALATARKALALAIQHEKPDLVYYINEEIPVLERGEAFRMPRHEPSPED